VLFNTGTYSGGTPPLPGLLLCGLLLGGRLEVVSGAGEDGGGDGGDPVDAGGRRTEETEESSDVGTRSDSKGVMGRPSGGRTGVRSGGSGGGEGVAPPAPPGPPAPARERLKSRQQFGQRHWTTSAPSGP
jgi:hypothetical protein